MEIKCLYYSLFRHYITDIYWKKVFCKSIQNCETDTFFKKQLKMYFHKKQEKIGRGKNQMLKFGKKSEFWDSTGS